MNKEKISVDDFVKKYTAFTSDKAKETYMASLMNSSAYISYAVKIVTAQQILQNSCFDKQGKVHIDSCKKYLLYIAAIFNFYTNIRLDETQIMQDYDTLEKLNLINAFIRLMPERELKMFDTVLKMAQDDLLANYCGLEHYLENKLSNIDQVSKQTLTFLLEKFVDMAKTYDNTKSPL